MYEYAVEHQSVLTRLADEHVTDDRFGNWVAHHIEGAGRGISLVKSGVIEPAGFPDTGLIRSKLPAGDGGRQTRLEPCQLISGLVCWSGSLPACPAARRPCGSESAPPARSGGMRWSARKGRCCWQCKAGVVASEGSSIASECSR